MILAREITKWEDGMDCNHTYILTENMEKIFGYFKKSNPKDFMMFKNPIRFDTRYRKFKVIKRNMYFEGQKSTNKIWEIKGSKDHVYTVEESENGMVCSCIGFKYHGKCKHIDGVMNEHK
jgi:hypothetical protein